MTSRPLAGEAKLLSDYKKGNPTLSPNEFNQKPSAPDSSQSSNKCKMLDQIIFVIDWQLTFTKKWTFSFEGAKKEFKLV